MDKNLYLIRGLPGAGKTTFVKSIFQNGDLVVAADDFMINEKGEYVFDPARLDDVRRKCKEAVEKAMKINVSRIFLTGTLTQQWELDPYYLLATKYGYKVFSVIIENRHEGKTIHGTPQETLDAMHNRFETRL